MVLSAVLMWPCLMEGRAFLPAQDIAHFTPWNATAITSNRRQWNPLGWDAVAQIYPWRLLASRLFHRGWIPLWNPYSFCGTPLAANDQSAVFYPGNLLFWVLPVWRALGWTAWLHLTLAGWFMALLCLQLGRSRIAAFLAGIIYATCSWQTSWLLLPTFLCTAVWIPLMMLTVIQLGSRCSLLNMAKMAAVGGMLLLAGHLQIALYGWFAALVSGFFVLWSRFQSNRRSGLITLFGLFAATAVSFILASVQLLPTYELSRNSPRTGAPTSAGYRAYVAYAPPLANLATLYSPNLFGNPSHPGDPYYGVSQGGIPFNFAEGAVYFGAIPLCLAFIGLYAPEPNRRLFGIIALLGLLLALGTLLDELLYFELPGFAASGSPGRALLLVDLGGAGLAAIGLDSMRSRWDRRHLYGLITLASAAVVTFGLAALWLNRYPGPFNGVLSAAAGDGWRWIAAFVALSVYGLIGKAGMLLKRIGLVLIFGLTIADLFKLGMAYNQTAPPQAIYPVTAGIRYLQNHMGHDRIMPINSRWSLFEYPDAVLPPNSASVYQLRDAQGYDSLFTRTDKAFSNRLSGGDSSPIEVGNMIFVKRIAPALDASAGVKYVVTKAPVTIPQLQLVHGGGMYIYRLIGSQGRAQLHPRNAGTMTWLRDDPTRISLLVTLLRPAEFTLAESRYPGWKAKLDGRPAPLLPANDPFWHIALSAGTHRLTFRYRPVSYRLGLYLTGLALAMIVGIGIGSRFTAPQSRN